MMHRKKPMGGTKMTVNEGYEGETIEAKVRRITVNKEPIKDGAQIIYTEEEEEKRRDRRELG